MTSEPILIWGAGAIGGTLGAAFARAGRNVVFVDTAEDHIKAIRENGLRIDGPLFQDTIKAPALLPKDLKGTFKEVFLCVKSHHTESACKTLAPFVAGNGFVVSAQNGLNERVIARELSPQQTVGCFVNFGADYMEPGVVHYSGRGAVVIGEIDGEIRPRTEDLFKLLSQFDDRAILTQNIWGFLWGKMVYGALLFATALTNESIADALAAPEHRPILTALSREVGRIAANAGLALEGFNGFDPTAFTPSAPAELTSHSFDLMVEHNRRSTKSHSGVWRDLAVRHRVTEVDTQLGPIVTTAEEQGTQAPITARLIAMIHEIETGIRPLSQDNLVELAKETKEGMPL